MWRLMNWRTIVDFVSVTLFLYLLLRLAREARALRTAFTIVALYAGALLARNFELVITSWVLEACAVAGVAVLLFTFQSEMRYLLLRLNSLFRLWPERAGTPPQAGRAIAEAAVRLAGPHTGALIVILGGDPVAGLVTGGSPIGAGVTAPLLESIFQKTSPLHDGAVVVAGDRIIQAGAILPLTERRNVPAEYGTRHRAALGLSERVDAAVVVVSEERGEVTLMRGGHAARITTVEELSQLLKTSQIRPKIRWSKRLGTLLFSDAKLKLIAGGLSALVWVGTAVTQVRTIRVVSAPVEFNDVPPGLDVNYRSDPRITLQLRGGSWMMDTASLSRLVVTFSLRNAPEGTQHFHVGADNVDLPAGIVLTSATPSDIVVRLARHKPEGLTPPGPPQK